MRCVSAIETTPWALWHEQPEHVDCCSAVAGQTEALGWSTSAEQLLGLQQLLLSHKLHEKDTGQQGVDIEPQPQAEQTAHTHKVKLGLSSE